MLLRFRHDPRGESVTWLRRDDGAEFLLHSYSRKWRVPHDLSHAVVERELGLAGGVFGCIASGVVFDSMTHVKGRLRHDSKARSTRILRAATRSIGTAEVLAGVVHHAVEKRQPTPYAPARNAWGIIERAPFPYADADIARATDTLRELGEQWNASPEPLDFDWPRKLRIRDRG